MNGYMRRKFCSRRTGAAVGGAGLLAVLLFSSGLTAQAARIHPSAGGTSAAFLKVGAGAKAVSMAGAFTAVADDASALYWNPAGLASSGERTISFSHNEYFQGLAQEFLSCSVPAREVRFLKGSPFFSGAWGLNLDYFYTARELERRSGLYEGNPLSPISPVEGTFRASDMAFALGYGYSPARNLDAGAALKLIRQSIDDASGSTFALDLGVLRDFTFSDRDFTAGFAVQNLGPGVKFVAKRYPLPLNFKAGISHRLPASGALLSLEADKPVDNYPFFALGAEFPLADTFALRAGYRYRLHGNELGGWAGFSSGFGFVLGKFSFDYAFTPFGELGNSHLFSLAFRFGRAEKPQPRTSREAVPFVEIIKSGTLRNYDVKPVPLSISPLGIRYKIHAENAESEISAMRFTTFMRGPAGVSLVMTEGELPAVLVEKLPGGFRVLKGFQLASSVGSIQGDIAFDLRLARERGQEGPAQQADGGIPGPAAVPETVKEEPARPARQKEVYLLYLAGNGWTAVKAGSVGEDPGFHYFTLSVPFSTHYALAEKSEE